mgnify:CR=1 FL=1|tara:strand:- start:552 stop:1241 length:690 start_codon:yes stop_codon:yes gene_type:complete
MDRFEQTAATAAFWDKVLETASSLHWVVAIFIGFLVIFHVILVGLLPLNTRQWKLVEYVWVSLAFISSLGFVDEARRYRAELHLNEVRGQLETSRRDVTDWFDSYQIYACEEAGGDLDREVLEAACGWFTDRQKDLTLLQMENRIAPDLRPTLLAGADRLTPLLSPENVAIITDRLATYQAHRQRYLELVEASRRGTLQKILIMLAPILFSAALALKMTKVTGEYRRMR